MQENCETSPLIGPDSIFILNYKFWNRYYYCFLFVVAFAGAAIPFTLWLNYGYFINIGFVIVVYSMMCSVSLIVIYCCRRKHETKFVNNESTLSIEQAV